MSVPVVLGRGGVKQILEWTLAPDEQELLQRSIAVIKPTMEYVEGLLHLCDAPE
jgi:malate/lactate dehydrogenase